jgi:hypothetical protein
MLLYSSIIGTRLTLACIRVLSAERPSRAGQVLLLPNFCKHWNGEFEGRHKIGQSLVTLVSKHSRLRREGRRASTASDIKGDGKCEPGGLNTLQYDVAQVHLTRQWATTAPY